MRCAYLRYPTWIGHLQEAANVSTTCQNQPGLPLSTAKGRCPGTGGRWPGLSSSTQQPWLLPVGHQACLPVHTPAVRELDQDPPFCYNGESSKFPFTGYCKATDINNCEILCLPKPYKYIKIKIQQPPYLRSEAWPPAWEAPSLYLVSDVQGCSPQPRRTRSITLTSNPRHSGMYSPYILAAERLLKIRKKYASLCMWQAGGTKSVCSASWNPWLSISQAPTNYLLFPFWKCMSQWLWGRSFIFNVVYSSEDRGFSTAASWDLRAPTSATEVQHWNRIIKWSD